jgi:hypothetical protein
LVHQLLIGGVLGYLYKENKICVRPKNINPSNNKNFWPENWIKI